VGDETDTAIANSVISVAAIEPPKMLIKAASSPIDDADDLRADKPLILLTELGFSWVLRVLTSAVLTSAPL
jgi:hypothetical protein